MKGLMRVFAGAALAAGLTPRPGQALEPAVSLVLGAAREMPFGPPNAHADYGTRAGLAFSSALEPGELHIPMEWGLSLRTASIGFDDWFDHTVFTDVQMPFLFHGGLPFWRRLEILGIWTPSYTLDMVSTSPDAGMVSGTRSLRTRFNMGLGAGMQLALPAGIRLRSHWVYNLFAPMVASRLTIADWNFEAALPFVWKRGAP